jgi:hypothetical protein
LAQAENSRRAALTACQSDSPRRSTLWLRLSTCLGLANFILDSHKRGFAFHKKYCSFPSTENLTTLLGANRSQFCKTVVVGRDGTVGRLVRGLKDRSIPIAILPTGTANNIARSLGIVGDPKDILAGIARAPIKSLDVGVAKGPWGKNYSSKR